MRFLVLGGGAQGSAAAFDLCSREEVAQVILADQDVAPLPPVLEQPHAAGRLERLRLDVRDGGALRAAMARADAVLCALPYYFNLPATQAAIDAGVHFCDLGGNTAIVQAQLGLDAAARAAGVSVIPDCGLAPGMVNILAEAGIRALDTAHVVRMFVGGLPRHPVPPLNYQIVYSLEGALDYYTTPSLILRHGEPMAIEPLSEVEAVDFPPPVGRLEAFHTAGGASLLPERHRGRIRTLEYKTLRFPGHAALMTGVRALGLLDTVPVEVGGASVVPRDLFIAAASPRLRRPGSQDQVVLRVDVTGERGGKAARIRWELIDVGDVDQGITAMMRSTGFSLAITALLQASGETLHRGVATPDLAIPADRYVERLAERGVRILREDA